MTRNALQPGGQASTMCKIRAYRARAEELKALAFDPATDFRDKQRLLETAQDMETAADEMAMARAHREPSSEGVHG
jgi:hypothetical protein